MTITPLISEPHQLLLKTRRLLAAVTLLLALIAIPASTAFSRASVRHHASAHAARSLGGSAIGHLHLVRAEGSTLIEEGPFAGALNGSIRAQLKTGAVFQGRFTIRTHRGSISGTGTGTPHGSGRYQSFGGTFQATGGSGLYVHIRGKSRMYGVFDRRADSFVIQTAGSFTY